MRSTTTWNVERLRRAFVSALVLFLLPVAARATAPTAVAGAHSNSGTVPATIQFDASGSTAPAATIVRYDWVFGDGAVASGLTGPTTSHTYTTMGNFVSSVTITTNLGDQATGWCWVVVSPRPGVLAVGSAQAQAGADITLDLTLTPSPDIGMSLFGFDVVLPNSVSYQTTTLGPAATAANKSVADNPAVPRVLISGFNQTTIGAGVVATLHLHVQPGTPGGTIPITLTNASGADATPSFTIDLTPVAGSIVVPSPVASAPTVPTDLAAFPVSSNQINLTWTASSNPGSSVAGYAVYRNAVFIASATTNAYADMGLSAGTQYSYAVSAYDPTGVASARSDTVRATTLNGTGAAAFSPRVFPSPWRSDQNSGLPITFDRLNGTSTIKVFSVSGRLVKEWSTTAASSDWNRDADSGGTVASGLYFYVITNSLGQKASGKLVVIQ